MNKYLMAFTIIAFLVSCSADEVSQLSYEYPEAVYLQEVNTIAELDEEEFFARPDMVIPLKNGHFLIADVQLFKIHHFDSEQNYLGSYGREGKGPGEFLRIDDIIVHDNSLQVIDGRNQRVSEFLLDENSLKIGETKPFTYMSSSEYPLALFSEFINSEEGLFTAVYYDFNMISKEEPRRTKIVTMPYNQTFEPEKESVSLALDLDSKIDYNRNILSIPYVQRAFYASIKNHLVYVINNEPMVKLYDREGNIVTEIVLPDTRRELSKSEKEEEYNRIYQNAENPAEFKSKVMPYVPDQRPIVRSVETDVDNRIWVRVFRNDDIAEDWIIFEADGTPVANLAIPEGYQFLNAKSNRMFTKTNTESGPEIVIWEW